MLDWLGDEGEQIRIAFSKVFGTRYSPFGSPSLQRGGLSDGKEGVQWNVNYDPRDGRQWVGVNLEGMQYDDWPVARLIERELREPVLPRLVEEHGALAPVLLVWHRDYWQATGRPRIQEKVIARARLGDLTRAAWVASLEEARGCLDSRRKYRGRAVQTVTLSSSGDRVEGEVSPHLMFRYMAPERMDWESLCRQAKAAMEPLHGWAVRRARKAVRF